MDTKAHTSTLARPAGHPAGAGHRLWLVVSVAVVLALVPWTLAPAHPAQAAAELDCGDFTLDVTLAPGATETYQVVGTLCSQGPAAGKTVQVLMHGSTYARYYWDLPYEAEHYSYVRAATRRGYATFNLDRIGNGASDHPDGNALDMNANGFVVHQVVQALRAGQVASVSFQKVIVVGHSMGSMTTLNYAGSYPGEADGIILTGLLHDINWAWASSHLLSALYPATLDEKFAGQFPNYDYLTTLPDARAGAFYYLPNADPAVIALDESLKQTTTMGELNTGPGMCYDPISLQIEGPVLVVVGQYDYLFCGNLVNCDDKAAVQEFEEAFYGPTACVETAVINDAGHSLTLQVNAQATYAQMLGWADRNVGRDAGAAPQPCAAP